MMTLPVMKSGLQDASLCLLRDASAVLASSYELSVTLPLVAKAATAHVADGCIIGLLEDDDQCHVMALTHRDPDKERQLVEAVPARAPSTSWLNALGAEARTELPLSIRGRHAGIIVFLNLHAPDVALSEFLSDLSARVSLSVENAHLHDRERRLAQLLQNALLPAQLPQMPGRTYHAAYAPASNEADVGGDWYDAFPLSDGSIALSIGDVAGHGLSAALTMGEVRQTFRVAAMHVRDPAAVLELANHLLLLRHEPVMVTAVFGIYDGKTFTYAVAGHPPPIIRMPGGEVYRLPASGLPLGIEAGGNRQVWTITIPSRSLLVLYTDGLIELTRNVHDGEALLTQAVKDEINGSNGDPAHFIRSRVLDGRHSGDDVAILTLSVDDLAVTELDATYSAVPVASPLVRQSITQLAQGLGLTSDQQFCLQVAVGEAVSNVIEHAYTRRMGSFSVRVVKQDGQLHVHIEDEGTWRPARQDDRGYGLSIIRSLMNNVRVNLTSNGTTLTFTQDLKHYARKHEHAAGL